jgi:hypothetical protein
MIFAGAAQQIYQDHCFPHRTQNSPPLPQSFVGARNLEGARLRYAKTIDLSWETQFAKV